MVYKTYIIGSKTYFYHIFAIQYLERSMRMNNAVFNRYEKKFIISNSIYEQLVNRILAYMVPDRNNKNGGIYTICNIYYDTDNDYLIRKSIDKPVYKKKFKGIVNKRRITLPLSEAEDYLNNNIMPSSEVMNSQIFKEIEYMRSRYTLVPKLYMSYDRRAYYCKDNDDLRITFDNNILARREDLRLEYGAYGKNILQEGYYIMEIKLSEAFPMWLTDILSELKVYKTSFSKYGTEYKGYLHNTLNQGGKQYV